MPLQVIEEAQKWCHRVSGGTELPALLSLADAAMTQFVASLQASLHDLTECIPLINPKQILVHKSSSHKWTAQ